MKQIVKLDWLKPTIEHREPIIVGFFILQNAKLSILEIPYNFLHKYYDESKFEEMEMDTDYLYQTLANEKIGRIHVTREDISMKTNSSKWFKDDFLADAKKIFFPRRCFGIHKEHDKREPGIFKKDLFYWKVVLCHKTYCCYDSKVDKTNLIAKRPRRELSTIKEMKQWPNTDGDTGDEAKEPYISVFLIELRLQSRG